MKNKLNSMQITTFLTHEGREAAEMSFGAQQMFRGRKGECAADCLRGQSFLFLQRCDNV